MKTIGTFYNIFSNVEKTFLTEPNKMFIKFLWNRRTNDKRQFRKMNKDNTNKRIYTMVDITLN